MFPQFRVANLELACSDHRPIELCLEKVGVRSGRNHRSLGFKFNAQWIRHAERRDVIVAHGDWAGR